ncbi:MAG TPA: hypothetical protein VN381_10835 [Anaerovoracaceae bacterium]|nr:hypothetical protein [Anaerovoracaceae bacterium]
MSRKKIFAKVTTRESSNPDDYCRVWITRDLATELDIAPKEDWLYLSKDWMGILSTQALVEGVLEGSGSLNVLASADRMVDAHFKDNDNVKVWKLTEWE